MWKKKWLILYNILALYWGIQSIYRAIKLCREVRNKRLAILFYHRITLSICFIHKNILSSKITGMSLNWRLVRSSARGESNPVIFFRLINNSRGYRKVDKKIEAMIVNKPWSILSLYRIESCRWLRVGLLSCYQLIVCQLCVVSLSTISACIEITQLMTPDC